MSSINYSDAGLASFQTDTFTSVELFSGDTPQPVTMAATVTSAPDGIPAYAPVYVDPETREVTITADDLPSGVTKANAIVVADIDPSDVPTSVPVYKAGSFNINAINWASWFGATEPTEDEKLAAFNMSESQIYVKSPFYG